MKTIKQIADEIGVSKQAIFYRMKKPPLSNTLQPLMTKLDGVLMVSFDGETLIKQAFGVIDRQALGDKGPSSTLQSFDGEIIKILQDNNETLRAELDIKNNQLAEKDKQIAELLKLNDQQQQLLLVEQQKYLTSVADQPPEVGFWQRIFGRKKG